MLTFIFDITSEIAFKLASVPYWHVSISFWTIPYFVAQYIPGSPCFLPVPVLDSAICPKSPNSFY